MFEVLSNEILALNLPRMQVKASRVAAARQAGTITLFIQAIGVSTQKKSWMFLSVRIKEFSKVNMGMQKMSVGDTARQGIELWVDPYNTQHPPIPIWTPYN